MKLITRLKNEWVLIRDEDRERNIRENHHFNPLRQITIKETDHSRILGELLDPRGSHGQGNLFLDAFLQRLGIEPLGGNWRVTIEAGRVDILLRRDNPPSVIIIENKSNNAQDQDGQLYRYWHDEIHARYSDLSYDHDTCKRFRVVYLPPGEYSRPLEKSLLRPAIQPYNACDQHPRLPESILDCRSFQSDVAAWLTEIAESNLSSRLKAFLKLYVDIWNL